jgi:hypothetical protein
MTQERFKFKTEQDYFEVGSGESANPFNLTYLTSQQTGNNKSTYETEQDYLEVGSGESENPFNLTYLTSQQTGNNKSTYETEQDYLEVGSGESANPFNLEYINNESMEITGPDNYSYREFYPEAEETADFYKVENLFNLREFEIFSNEVQDQEFKNALDEIASDSENKFQSFMQQNQGDSRYFENMLADPNFERNFDQFFEIEYGSGITEVKNELDRLTNYVEQNSHPGMNYEEVQSLIDSFEVEPEHFFGKLAKLGKSIVNKGIKLAKGGLKLASKVASKVGKTLLAGPLLKMITNRLKNSITPLVKSLLEKVKGKLPEQYRGLAEKAFGALTQTGDQANVQANGSSAGGTAAGTSSVDTADTVNTSEEIFELYESESQGPDEMAEITELERKLDKQIYLLAQNFEDAQENLYYVESEEFGQPSAAAIAEQFLDREQTEEEKISASPIDNQQQSAFTILDNSKNEFVSGIANNTMEIRELTQNFVPVVMAALPVIKTVLKLTGGRQKIVNLISNMAAGLLGKLIGTDQAAPLSKILVDKGLTLLGLEIPEPTPNQYLATTFSNIIAETTDKVSQLPESILNGDEVILRSFVNEALLSSIANNFPPSVLNHSTNTLRELPAGMNWVSEKNGYYQILNKEFQFVLKPEEAAKIYTRRGETLLDNLSKYQGWDGKTPVPVIGYVFQSNPLTRLAMIARDYAGGDSSDKKRQIIRLNPNAATILFKEPTLAMTRGRIRGRFSGVRWYYIKLANSSNKNQTFPSPIQSTSQSPAQSTTPIVNENIRANDVQIKIVEGPSSQYQLKVNIYLNEATSERIKSVPKSVQPTSLYKELESILIPLGGKTIGDMLVRLAIPQYAKNQIKSMISGRILDYIRSNLHLLNEEYLTQSAKDEFGVTILIEFGLPGDFMKNLTNLNLANIGSFISKLSEIRPLGSIKTIAGYKL